MRWKIVRRTLFYHFNPSLILGWQVLIGIINFITCFIHLRSICEVSNPLTYKLISLEIFHCVTLKICCMLQHEQQPVTQQQLPCLFSTSFIFRVCRLPVMVFVYHQFIHHVVLYTFFFKRLYFIHFATKNWLNIFAARFSRPCITIVYYWNKMTGHSKLDVQRLCG